MYFLGPRLRGDDKLTTAGLAAVGVIPALLSLANRIGRQRRYPATLESIRHHDDQVLEIVCRPNPWPGHRAGQFLFADFGQRGEGAHPFTIASAWDEREGTLTLAIKALGDFTAKLPTDLQAGQGVRLEGPYGGFDFGTQEAKASTPQVWVAGGIGITPFLAKLNERAGQAAPAADTDLFYCTRAAVGFPDRLAELCTAAGVRLHHRRTDAEGPLDPADVSACLKPGSSVWFCGPAAWGSALARTLTGNGLPRAAFHREVFEFR